jgi:hypothetical protein
MLRLYLVLGFNASIGFMEIELPLLTIVNLISFPFSVIINFMEFVSIGSVKLAVRVELVDTDSEPFAGLTELMRGRLLSISVLVVKFQEYSLDSTCLELLFKDVLTVAV